jgi:putative transposase/transposase-like zinc-binding protein
VGAILRQHGAAFGRHHRQTPPGVLRVLARLAACRTAALGGHVTECGHCGDVRYHYHSCGERHCPACGGSKRAAWLERRRAELLAVPYFHVVFTLPHQLSALVLGNRRLLYPLLMRTAAQTLLDVAADPKHRGARLGVLAVLHTWGQQLEHHPHVHAVVPGGGLTSDGQRWLACRPNFLLPVKVLGTVFRGKYLEGLRQAYVAGTLQLAGSTTALAEPTTFAALLDELYRTAWVVYAKQPFGRDPELVLKYLARYTHRVAFSNARLVRVSADTVTFTYKDYADGCRSKEMTLPALEFVRRFAMHVVPGRLVRIRQYGLLANRGRGARLAQCRRLLPSVVASASTATPSCSHDYRWLILMTLLVATTTPAALAPLSEQRPNVPACAICGAPLRTLWQAPRPGSRKVPTLAYWTDQGEPPLCEDSS